MICVENAGSNGRVIKEDSAQNRYIDFQNRLSGEGGRSFFVPLAQLVHRRQPLWRASDFYTLVSVERFTGHPHPFKVVMLGSSPFLPTLSANPSWLKVLPR